MRTIITNEGSFKRYENKLQLLASAREKLMLAAVDNDKETVRVARDYQKAYYSFLVSVADYLCGKEDYSAMLPQKGSFTLFLRSIYINYLQHQEALSGIHFGNRNQEHWQELVEGKKLRLDRLLQTALWFIGLVVMAYILLRHLF